MRLRLPKLAFTLGVSVLLLVAALLWTGNTNVQAQGHEVDDGFASGQGLGGTWSVKVTLTNCETGALIGNPFNSYLSFAGNGTMTENTSNPGFAVGQRGPGLGVWEHTGWRHYSAKSIAFILFTTPPAPPTNPGFTMGTQTIAQTIKMTSPDEFSSDATISFADAGGNVYRSGCAVATGTRFE